MFLSSNKKKRGGTQRQSSQTNNFGRKTQTIKLFQCSVLNDISRIIKVKGFIPEVQVLFFSNNVNYFVIKYIDLLDIQTGELNFF